MMLYVRLLIHLLRQWIRFSWAMSQRGSNTTVSSVEWELYPYTFKLDFHIEENQENKVDPV